ncbi:Alpha crystallin/Hsp20 domain-containing protein [Cinnamomum micranthum f. kanehirae]|uniref:Alpha crystallin/Hsp20 domain-containing protein n=1 Tax=Cinnamomum micranthum f. kanehirae TaxID=337451 RepID=A0A3S3PLK5_9MAGN|nr:Alpha crystallin/Hsp20 domain-containing protein [Cinnamomum micranthum f. kanehirae]
MDTKLPHSLARSYEDFQPSSDWLREDKSDTLVVRLPGFVKEQLRVQLDNKGVLKVSGERPIQGNKWTRFRKDFHVPDHCDVTQIRATFDDGALYITMPKTNLTSPQPTKPTRTTQKPSPVEPTPRKDQTSFQPKTKPDTTKSSTPQPSTASAGDTDKQTSEKHTKDKNEKQEPQGSKLPAQEMTSGRDKSNGLSVNGKEKDSREHAVGAETVSFGKERSSWNGGGGGGDGGGLMTLAGLRKYKPRKLVVSVVVGVVVAVAIGIGLYEAYKGMFPEESGV